MAIDYVVHFVHAPRELGQKPRLHLVHFPLSSQLRQFVAPPVQDTHLLLDNQDSYIHVNGSLVVGLHLATFS